MTEIEKEFVPYEEAVALKELGFYEPCFAKYDFKKLLNPIRWNMVWCENTLVDEIYAPTFSQAFRFFRDKNYEVSFRKMDYGNDSVFTGYYYTIYKGMETIDLHGADKRTKTYEEIELACLRKLIEVVKEKNK